MSSKNEWFGQWFDSKYYHILYKHRDHEEAELFIDNISALLDLHRGSKVMDLACGKGRHSIYLNKKGFDVTGLDLSQQNIRHAKKFEKDDLQFHVHDMRNVWSENEFDCIVNLFTSFGYFESEQENENVVKAVAKALKPGGRFVLDFLNPYTVIHHLVHEEVKIIDGIEFHINKVLSDDGFILKNINFLDGGEEYFFQEKVKAIRRLKFLEYFEHAGLQLINIFGDYDLQKYVAEESERMIFYVQK